MRNSNISAAQQQEFGRHMSRVAENLLGQPNWALSKKNELRFGTNGSLSVDLRKGTFFDFEANEGGGVLDLINRERGLTGSAAIDFLREIGCDLAANKKQKRELVATFDYQYEDRSVAFQVQRFEPKQFIQRRPTGKGGWGYKGGPPLLYRMPQVLEAVAQGQTIFVVEGEGKVEALAKWNVPATCNAGGAKKWKPEHSDYLRGANVVILPDNDAPGRNHVEVVGASLQGIASSVRVLELPDLRPKGDIVNWIEAGGTREIFLKLVETEARPYRGRPRLHVVTDTGKFIEARCEAENDDAKNIGALARLSLIDYDRVRAYEADRLGCRPQTLDKVVKAQRKNKQPKPAVEVDKEALARSAAHIVNSKDVLGLFMRECSKVVAGEEGNTKLLYLIGTSRLLNKTMHGAIKGTSAGGKSEMRKRTLEFFPPESVVSFTSLSEKFLIYYEDDFQHKILSMGEAVATDEQDFQDYLLRELMSEGHIRHSTVQKVGNEMMTVTIEKEGPVSFMVTTTKNQLHPENETRMLSLEINDSENQTRAVLNKVAEVEGLNHVGAQIDYDPWRDFQRWLEAGERRVVVPFARKMVELIPPASVRLRRDAGQVIRAIKAHALLHREHRERDADGQIVANIEHDYAVVRKLMNALLAESSGLAVKQAVVETVEAVKLVTKGMASDEGATAQTIGKVLKLDKSAAWRRLNAAQTEGFIRKLEVRRGQPGRYRATGQEVEAAVILPSPAELEDIPSAPPSKLAQPCNRTNKDEYLEEDDGCKADCNRAHPHAPPGEPVADGCRPVATPLATAKSLNDSEELLPVARLPENLKETEGVGADDGRVCAQCGAGGTDLDQHDQAGDVWLHPECRRFWKPAADDLTIPEFLQRN